MIRSSAVAALVVAGLASGCDKGGSAADQHPDDGKELQETRGKIDALTKPLIEMHARTPEPAKAEEKPCEGLAGGRMAIAEYEYLGRFAHPDRVPYSGSDARWKELTTPALRVVTPSARAATQQQAIDALWNVKKLGREYAYLGVLRASERTGPKLDGERFSGGKYSGILQVFDLEKAKPLCSAKLSATSSTEVAGSINAKDREDVLWNDFMSNVRDAVYAGAKRVAPDLNVDL
ncbi:MAG: hypothetical protein H6717_34230 [Polyangiaceae bacterium]|nr:hypothetical protein [Polyangiaceae bacterium]